MAHFGAKRAGRLLGCVAQISFAPVAFFVPFLMTVAPSQAETMSSALAKAYSLNPDLNQQRANVRSTDENLPKARAGWLPKINATGQVGEQYSYVRGAPSTGSVSSTHGRHFDAQPRGYGATASQTVFDGFKTLNSVRQAESQVLSARETARNTEQTVLLNGATYYMNVLRDIAVLDLRKNNISVLEEQLRQTRDRFQVGELTRTDVAQAESALAQARSDFFGAQANLQSSLASYRQTIGVEPNKLAPAKSIENLLPKQLSIAVSVSQVDHPNIVSALHSVDSALAQVKIAEAALYPVATVNGSVNRLMDGGGSTGAKSFTASVSGNVTVPIYQGGAEYASIRQAKEALGQARLQADVQRNTVRAQVVTAWGQLEAAKAQLISGQAAVAASEVALAGIREEARVGQRTTFDVLQQQLILLNNRVNLVTAQRDRVVASYAILSAMGGLSAERLNLTAQLYDPTNHFDQVKNKLFGVSAPDAN